MITRSLEETKSLARRLASVLSGGENLLLIGDLGSGKTAFVQGLAEGLGISEPVKSPTYTYLREYAVPRRSTKLAHFDLYRLPDRPSRRELESLELFERLGDPDTITVVEWADKLGGHSPTAQFTVEFSVEADTHRKVQLPEALRKALPT
jgi:tRNA threonylcarbamoyladenosine biosynthesis protein TsaE